MSGSGPGRNMRPTIAALLDPRLIRLSRESGGRARAFGARVIAGGVRAAQSHPLLGLLALTLVSTSQAMLDVGENFTALRL